MKGFIIISSSSCSTCSSNSSIRRRNSTSDAERKVTNLILVNNLQQKLQKVEEKELRSFKRFTRTNKKIVLKRSNICW